MRNEHCGVPSPPRAWHTLLYRDPPSHVPRPPECWALPVPWPWPKSCPRWGGESHGRGSGRPQTYCILMPPSPPWGAAPLLPVHAWLSPLSSWQCWLCHPTPVARATPEPAARVTACAAAHAQLGMVPVASPGPHGRGCHGMVLPGAPAGAAAEWAHPGPWNHQSITGPDLLHSRCWLSPSPTPSQRCRHVASSWDCPLPVQATTPQRGWLPRGMSLPAGMSLELCTGIGAWGRTSRRSAWLSTCRRLFLART